jgi:hypothetical protein
MPDLRHTHKLICNSAHRAFVGDESLDPFRDQFLLFLASWK